MKIYIIIIYIYNYNINVYIYICTILSSVLTATDVYLPQKLYITKILCIFKILIFQTYCTHLYASRIYTTLGKVVYFTTWIPQGFNPQGPGNVAQRFKIGSKRSTVA